MEHLTHKIWPIIIYKCVFFGMIIVLFISYFPQLVSGALVNVSLLQFAKATFCDPRWIFCHADNSIPLPIYWQKNSVLLTQASETLNIASRLSPGNKKIQLNLAYIYFALGDRQDLLAFIPAVNKYQLGQNPLTSKNRYEYHLFQAQKFLHDKEWDAAIQEFYQAMSMQIEYILPIDDRDLYEALGNQQIELYNANPENFHALYLAGKYFFKAGLLDETLLLKITNLKINDQLGIEDVSRAWLNLGQIYSYRGNVHAARMAYEKAITIWPEFREPYFDLILLLTKYGMVTDAQKYTNMLTQIGPTYHLGEYAIGYEIDKPVTLPNQWQLVGYELDEQLLDVATAIDVILWWQIPSNIHPPGDMIQIGNYWLQKQTLRNLFVNSGFEWGVDNQGLPVGQYHEYYGAPQGSLSVDIASINGIETHVLVAKNSTNNQYVALGSQFLIVDPEGFYLMAGKSLDQNRLVKIGRNCFKKPYNQGEPNYIKSNYMERPINTWISFAELSRPFQGSQIGECEILLSNINSQSWAQWDNIIWARIDIPKH